MFENVSVMREIGGPCGGEGCWIKDPRSFSAVVAVARCVLGRGAFASRLSFACRLADRSFLDVDASNRARNVELLTKC
jgi:hypothetical protein